MNNNNQQGNISKQLSDWQPFKIIKRTILKKASKRPRFLSDKSQKQKQNGIRARVISCPTTLKENKRVDQNFQQKPVFNLTPIEEKQDQKKGQQSLDFQNIGQQQCQTNKQVWQQNNFDIDEQQIRAKNTSAPCYNSFDSQKSVETCDLSYQQQQSTNYFNLNDEFNIETKERQLKQLQNNQQLEFPLYFDDDDFNFKQNIPSPNGQDLIDYSDYNEDIFFNNNSQQKNYEFDQFVSNLF